MIENSLDLLRFSDETCLRLIITLLHFLWQGTALALIVLIGGWGLRHRSAASRYALNTVSLFCMPVCVAATFLLVDVSDWTRPMPGSTGGSARGSVNAPPPAALEGVSLAAESTVAQEAPDTKSDIGSSVSQTRPSVTGSHIPRQLIPKSTRAIAAVYLLCVCFFLLRLGAAV